MIWTLWWAWLAAALFLGVVEMVVPGFLFLGFAAGALAMALLVLNLGLALSLPMALLVWAALSLVAWLVLRRIFTAPKGQVTRFDHDVND